MLRLEVLCDCGDCKVESYATLLNCKVETYWLEPTPQSQLDYYWYKDVDKSWKIQLHELNKEKYRCLCPISSTEWVIS